MSKKISPLIAIGMILILAFLIGIYAYLNSRGSIVFSADKILNKNLGWKTYTSRKCGFEIKYPQSHIFKLYECSISLYKSTIDPLNHEFVLQAGAYPYEESIETWKKNYEETYNIDPAMGYFRKINFLGKDAYDFVFSGISDGTTYHIVTKNQGHIYEIELQDHSNIINIITDILLRTRKHLTQEQNLILSTFKFIERDQTPCTNAGHLCPDGSVVRDTGPNCEYEECPKTQTEEKNK